MRNTFHLVRVHPEDGSHSYGRRQNPVTVGEVPGLQMNAASRTLSLIPRPGQKRVLGGE